MKTNHKLVLAALMIVAVAGCASVENVKVQSGYDPGTDFSDYRNYNWLETSPPNIQDPRVDPAQIHRLIQEGMDNYLATRRFKKVASGADFLITYRVSVKEELVKTEWDVYDGGPGWDGRSWEGTETDETYYDVGTLVIAMHDTNTNQVLWRGSADGIVDYDASPEKREKRIAAAVSKILKHFPPPTT